MRRLSPGTSPGDVTQDQKGPVGVGQAALGSTQSSQARGLQRRGVPGLAAGSGLARPQEGCESGGVDGGSRHLSPGSVRPARSLHGHSAWGVSLVKDDE